MEKMVSLEISCSYIKLAKKAAAEKTDLLVLVTIKGKGHGCKRHTHIDKVKFSILLILISHNVSSVECLK